MWILESMHTLNIFFFLQTNALWYQVIYLTTVTDKIQLSCPALGFNKAPLFLLALFCSVKDSEVTWTWSPEGAIRNGRSPSLEILTPRGTFSINSSKERKIYVIKGYGKMKMGRVISLFHLYYLYRREYLKHPFLWEDLDLVGGDWSHCWIPTHLSAWRQDESGVPSKCRCPVST